MGEKTIYMICLEQRSHFLLLNMMYLVDMYTSLSMIVAIWQGQGRG